MFKSIYLSFIFTFSIFGASAQKGLPSESPTSATVNTKYPSNEVFTPEKLRRLKVPGGYKVTVAASGLGKPRMLAALDANSLYVTRRDQGDVLLLRDKNNDGTFEEMTTVLTQFKGVHGIAIHEGFLYLCANKQLRRAKIKPDGTLEKDTTLISNLPDAGQHPNRTIAFGPDNKLYITVGSDCNDCYEPNPELATILQSSPDGSSRKVFARGLRNTIGFGWHPVTKEMWGADNGGDYKGDNWPPEEINRLVEDGHYGWPIAYGNNEVDYSREDPAGATKEEFVKKCQPSALDLPAHSAPIAFTFLPEAKNFPEDMKDDGLLCLHGSWNKKDPDGFKVVRIKFENGTPTGSEDFVSGFLNSDGESKFGRPAGITCSPRGDIYFSDDLNGNIYRVSYNVNGN